MFQVIIHEEVVLGLEAAACFYEEQRSGLGEAFAFEFEIIMAQIVRMPYSFTTVFGDYRQVIMNRFPFIILYRVEANTIEVSNLIHAKQHPRKRLKR